MRHDAVSIRIISESSPRVVRANRRDMEAASKSRREEPRRRISGDERRESILQLTSRAFAERGYDGVRTAELAESAGVSEALIYQHFRTKAELYRAAVDRSADIFEERLGAGGCAGPAGRGAAEARARRVPRVRRRAGQRLDGADAERQRSRARGLPARAARRARPARLPTCWPSTRGRRAPASTAGELEQLAEIIAGGAEALATWWAQNPKAERAELVALLMGFVWSGFDRMVDSSAKRRG